MFGNANTSRGMEDRRGKRALILLSSEEDEEEEEEDDEGGDVDNEDEDYNNSDNQASESDDNDNDDDDDESLSDKVVALLREGNDIESLKLNECKAYLRKHGLRIGGTRAVCVDRIREHWRLKDGNGYSLYPESSFIINCTVSLSIGDVCKGDFVLFRQKVYERFDKMTRHGRILGNRTIAGRVVKESYGAAKQQHTFTVEVLWSSGVKKLPPLFPLLVKGRNLYRQKTYRQRWKNEADRAIVLSEKHRKGAAARLVRAIRQKRKSHHANESKGSKRQHEIPNTKRPKIGRSCEPGKVRDLSVCRRANNFQPQELISSASSSKTFRSREWQKSAEYDHYQVPIYSSHSSYQLRPYQFHHSHVNHQSMNEPSQLFYHERGPISNMIGFSPFRPDVTEFTSGSRPLVSMDYHHSQTELRYNHEMNYLNGENVGRPLQFPPRTYHGYRRYFL
ncbi:PREDICTED: zinc finger CCCH domain-containing protein 62-like isoform X1 [Lupinus angustifolius]|uniref:zinc finger CCCH domain-containing protein 62-like isoform X1 n=1 Tax=Lupinus angustifolius TaxID=3871 RepID=UPI00092ED094|nr:PREDICTED: zinc finger CCCH domain-containing protein 62-like isoform X1 [Lupinus angustifolius]XP_019420302.1 PREDICTED: zinc finger CCCH domain-containing protein 62-like isoform X1 [Lupinus angustifolius]